MLDKFNDISVGTDFFQKLDITQGDLMSPVNERKIQEIAEFLNDHPDPHFIVDMIRHNRSPHMSNLDFLTGFVQLNKKRAKLEGELSKVVKDIKFYENG